MTPGNQQLERRVGEASTGKPIALQSEAEFRKWFEQNLLAFGVRKIILSQEPCPDYVLQMQDGRIVRVEAELFAVNFRYHRHDPRKVDFILAAYSHADLSKVCRSRLCTGCTFGMSSRGPRFLSQFPLVGMSERSFVRSVIRADWR